MSGLPRFAHAPGTRSAPRSFHGMPFIHNMLLHLLAQAAAPQHRGVVALLAAAVSSAVLAAWLWGAHRRRALLSVNFHFTRVCNYSCKFCFHTAKTDTLLPLADVKKGLRLLADAGLGKVGRCT